MRGSLASNHGTNYADLVRNVPNELKGINVKICNFKRDEQLVTYVYDLESMPPATARIYCANLFKSLAEFQFNVMQNEHGAFRISLSISFNPTKSPTTFDADILMAKNFDIQEGNNKIELRALNAEEHKGMTRIPRNAKSIVLYRCSVYFAEDPSRISAAISEYADIEPDKIIVPMKNGIFDGTIRIPVKRFKTVPPHSVAVPEYYPDGTVCKLRRSILVRSYGYDPETPTATEPKPKQLKCIPCQKKNMNPNHDPKTCRHKKCSNCLQYNLGCGPTAASCKELTNILRGKLPKKIQPRKMARAKQKKNEPKNRQNLHKNSTSLSNEPGSDDSESKSPDPKALRTGQTASKTVHMSSETSTSGESSDFDNQERTTQVQSIFNNGPDPVVTVDVTGANGTTPVTDGDANCDEKMQIMSEKDDSVDNMETASPSKGDEKSLSTSAPNAQVESTAGAEVSLPPPDRPFFDVPSNPFANSRGPNSESDRSSDFSDPSGECSEQEQPQGRANAVKSGSKPERTLQDLTKLWKAPNVIRKPRIIFENGQLTTAPVAAQQ